jgi:hypothetical protein
MPLGRAALRGQTQGPSDSDLSSARPVMPRPVLSLDEARCVSVVALRRWIALENLRTESANTKKEFNSGSAVFTYVNHCIHDREHSRPCTRRNAPWKSCHSPLRKARRHRSLATIVYKPSGSTTIGSAKNRTGGQKKEKSPEPTVCFSSARNESAGGRRVQ